MRYRRLSCAIVVWVLLAPDAAYSQTAPSGAQVGRNAQLSAGWNALASRRITDAAEIARRLLQASPRDHDAAALDIAAALAGPGADTALTHYETWLTASQREHAFLLEDIGRAVLQSLAASDEPRVRFAALAHLARAGDQAAIARLKDATAQQTLPIEAEAAMADAGLPGGQERLARRIRARGSQDKSLAIDALKDSGDASAAAIIAEALGDPAPTTRIAAAIALVELGATPAIPQLRSLIADPEPQVRGIVRVALGLLGDAEFRDEVDTLPTSPLPDFRLLHARMLAQRDKDGPWVAPVEALTAHPDPSVRVAAIELLVSHERVDAGLPALSVALGDPAAPVRTLAARVLRRVPPSDRAYGLIRKSLRDPVADVRLEAARALVPIP